MTGKSKSQITFQLVSLYDQTAEKFVQRVSNHLRDTLGVIYEFPDFKIHKNMNILLGDVEPPNHYYNDIELNYLIYNLFDYQNVEEIIREINEQVYGISLTDIPEPSKSYIVKIVSDFSS